MLDDLARLVRAESGLILASLIKLGQDIQLAEDALQDACLEASKKWSDPQFKKPKNQTAWLFTVARRRLIDRLRQQSHQTKDLVLQSALESLQHTRESNEETQEIPDERLKLIFTCCHPALSSEAQIGLTLNTLCGLSTEEIARAFLISHTTLQQRLVRAKRKIKLAGIAYQVPSGTQLHDRLQSVLAVIYLIFNESYSAYEGQSLSRSELGDEAIRLARVLNHQLPKPEVAGLLALMLLHQARDPARSSLQRTFIPLQEQDRSLWNQEKVSNGRSLLLAAMSEGRPGKYQVQAAISALHNESATWADTDWQQIKLLYRKLYELEPSAVIALNMHVAAAQLGQAEQALHGINALEPALSNYQPYFAARAAINRELNHVTAATEDYKQAIRMSKNGPERDYLQAQLAKLGV